jgi:hypothetical protein
MTHIRIHFDNLSGLPINSPISPPWSKPADAPQSFQNDFVHSKCMKIHHNVGILWDLMDHTELCVSNPVFAERLPIRASLVNALASGIPQLFKAFHKEVHGVEDTLHQSVCPLNLCNSKALSGMPKPSLFSDTQCPNFPAKAFSGNAKAFPGNAKVFSVFGY